MKYCTKCGHQNPDEAQFCSSCGNSFVAATGSQPSLPPGQPSVPSLASAATAPAANVGANSVHCLTEFPVIVLILLHFCTCGIFSLVWLNLMHGKLPKVRHDDPSAGRAVGFCFIPFYNFYWIFFTYRRLCLRIDEQRTLYGLAPGNLRGLATTACILHVIPYVNVLIGLTIMTPIFIGMMQSSVNELVRQSAQTTPRPLPTVPPTGSGMPGWAIALIVCVAIIPMIGLLAAIAIPNFVRARQTAQAHACINNLRIIEAAKQQWALEHKKSGDDVPSAAELFGPGKYMKKTPVCPAGGTYSINAVDTPAECSLGKSTRPAHKMPEFR